MERDLVQGIESHYCEGQQIRNPQGRAGQGSALETQGGVSGMLQLKPGGRILSSPGDPPSLSRPFN